MSAVVCAIDLMILVHLFDITQYEFMLFTLVHGFHQHILIRDVTCCEGDLSVIPMKAFVNLCLRHHHCTQHHK